MLEERTVLHRIGLVVGLVLSAIILSSAFLLPHKGWEKNGSELVALALALHWEGAIAEPTEGLRAIAHVVLNRVESKDFPNTVRGVVAEGAVSGRHSGCQFSFACDGEVEMPQRLYELHPRDTEALGPAFCTRRWIESLTLAALWL
jgi:hypothetical protein